MESKPEYLFDADEMIGAGYEHPSVEIDPGTTIIERHGREFKEVQRPAFVKISTGFKAEMKDIDEISLKVWLFIALSVNRNTGRANPGLRTIAEQTGFAVNTVRAAIDRLENKYGLLIVDRESRKYNIYEPSAFVSANRKDPDETVSPGNTVDQSVSAKRESVSVDAESVSPRMILNQINQSNQKEEKEEKNIFTLYSSTIGPIIPNLVDELKEYNSLPYEWLESAFKKASDANARRWAYVRAILEGWKANGYGWKPGSKNYSKPAQPSRVAVEEY